MADEPIQEQESQEPEAERSGGDQPAGREPEADQPAGERPGGEQPETEEPPAGEQASAEEAPDASEAPAPEASQEEPLTPKQVRKRARSLSGGPPKPPRSPSERAAERASQRAARAASRRRRRAAVRSKRGEPRRGTPPAERRPGTRKVRQGTVISAKPDKTITVQIEIARRHPTYEKVVRRSATLHAHDERNDANEGDVVRVIESRPLSRTKRWRLVEILERAR